MRQGDEATISYGKHSNDELLLRFGFCIEGNRDEIVPLPGCMAELDWLIADTDRERDMKRDGLVAAVTGAHVDSEARRRRETRLCYHIHFIDSSIDRLIDGLIHRSIHRFIHLSFDDTLRRLSN